MQNDELSGGGTGGTGSSGTGGAGSLGGGGLSGSGGSGSLGGGGLSGSEGSLGGLSGTGGGGTGSLGGGGLSGSTGGSTGTGGMSSGSGVGGGYIGADVDDFEVHEGQYQRHYTLPPEPATPSVTSFDEARTGYAAGHRAAANPAYAGRPYEEVEVELEREYPQPERFAAVRGYARHAFNWKTIVGTLAVAGGAYWASRKLSQAVSEMREEDEQDCRTYYQSHPAATLVPYDQARTVYVIGYAAARNPDYAGRSYDDVETHLRSGFTGPQAGSYEHLRDFTRRGYERGSSRGSL